VLKFLAGKHGAGHQKLETELRLTELRKIIKTLELVLNS